MTVVNARNQERLLMFCLLNVSLKKDICLSFYVYIYKNKLEKTILVLEKCIFLFFSKQKLLMLFDFSK